MKFTINTGNKGSQDALNLIQYTRQSVFLTGEARTGKSAFLKYICGNTKKKHIIPALVGTTTINTDSSILHGFFKLPSHPLLPGDSNLSLQRGYTHKLFKYTRPHRKLLEQVELVIIDGISIVRADMTDAIDRILRVYSRDLRDPFGGKRVLLVGGVFQPEPVIKGDGRETINRFYPTPCFSSTWVFNEIELVSIKSQRIYRQSDAVFVSVLDHTRSGAAGAADLQLPNTCYGAPIDASEEDMYTTLATRRDTVETIDDQRLAEPPEDLVVLEDKINGDFPESSPSTSKDLTLKPGAQIIFIRSDFERRWVNGVIGIVGGVDNDDTIYIIIDGGKEYDVHRESWRNIRHKYNEEEREIEEEELGTFTQYPIRLAWTITVHRSQGLTLSCVVIDFTGGVFAGGQAYVALSCCTLLEGIQLKRPASHVDIFIYLEIVSLSGRFNNRQAIDKALKQARADVQCVTIARAFDKGDSGAYLEQLFLVIRSRYDIERSIARKLVRRRLGVINLLCEQRRKLQEQMAAQQKSLRKYAREYLLMDNEYITWVHDTRAALANHDKTIEPYPEYTGTWIREGITLLNEKEFSSAESCPNRVVSLRPTDFKALYNRGKLRLKTENTEGALTGLDKTATLKPKHPGVHGLFGDALLKVGKETEAAIQRRIAEKLQKKKK